MKKTITLLMATATLLAGCGTETTTKQATDKLTVYTTIFPLQSFTQQIGSSHVDVKSVYPPGTEAHTFDPSQKLVLKIADADAFIYSGTGVEPFADKLQETLKQEDVTFVKAGKGIDLLAVEEEHHHDEHSEEEHHEDEHAHEEEGHDHDHGNLDPHVWLDPTLAKQMAQNITTSLSKLQPKHKAEFEANFKKLAAELDALDQKLVDVTSTAKKKELLVSHAAYGYWAAKYELEQISATGISPSDEPSQKELAELIKVAKEHGLKYMIFEENVTPKVANIIKQEIGAESLTLNNFETVSKEDIKAGKTYVDLMNENIETLKKALN